VNCLFAKDKNCVLKSGLCQTTYFQSIAEFAQVQMAHRDVNHLPDFKNQIMILLALQDDTEFALIQKSHAFHSDKQFNQGVPNWTTASKFKLKKGQFIAFHPKTVHMGWTCKSDNYRVHFYLGKQPKSNFNSKNDNTVKIVTEKCFARITGANKTKHLSEFGTNYRSKKKNKLLNRQEILKNNKKMRL
jgi:ectoine hydroxylase-related dioxygenase (phytanoyl-CoA dioxygenase family)